MPRIAYFRPAPFPPANEKVLDVLKAAFPNHEIDTYDILDILQRRRLQSGLNFFHTAWHYGGDIMLGRKQPLSSFFRTPYMFRQIKEIAKDCVTGKDYHFTFQIQSLFDASVPGVPHFVYTDHTHLANLHYAHFKMGNLYPRHWLMLERSIYHNALVDFTRSTNVSRSLICDYGCPKTKVECVFAGSNAPVHKGRRDYTQKTLLFVGVEWERKGGRMLIEAFRIVRKRHPDARLLIVGCRPDIDEPNCEVIGKVTLDEVSAFYDRSSVFCMPTRIEPFGIAFVEALSYGLPIVATQVGALPDIVRPGKNGFLVEPDDVQGMARAINKLLDSPSLCARFGRWAIRHAKETYSWDKVGKKMRRRILSALADKRDNRAEFA